MKIKSMLAHLLLMFGGLVVAGLSNANASAFDDQASNSQVSVYTISDEESGAFDAAMREADPQKRAEKLYDFIQKYPQSPLIKRISNENYDRIKMIEDERTAYYSAAQQPDPEKRAEKLLDFNKAYSKSALTEYVRNDYMDLLKALFQNKKYDMAASLGEKWLAANANDKNVYAFVGDVSMQLGKYQRCGECLEIVYQSTPSASLARQIQGCYQKADNRSKMIEWTDKLFGLPEYSADYMLRHEYMMFFYSKNNLAKATEYAQLTLKSADLAKPADANAQEQLRKVRRACHHVIASALMEQSKFTEAITEFEKALEAERYSQGYYGIALCYDNKKSVDEAILYYAIAELMGGEDASKAKARMETLYKAIHNDTLIGVDKVYSKAQKVLDGQKS